VAEGVLGAARFAFRGAGTAAVAEDGIGGKEFVDEMAGVLVGGVFLPGGRLAGFEGDGSEALEVLAPTPIGTFGHNLTPEKRKAGHAAMPARDAEFGEGRSIAASAIKATVIGCVVIYTTVFTVRMWQFVSARPPLFGIYEVEQFMRKGEDLPPLATDSNRWNRVVFEFSDLVEIETMDGRWHVHRGSYDAANQRFSIAQKDSADREVLACLRTDREHLILEGTYLREPLRVKIKRIDSQTFPLLRSRFEWINGFP
jgi:hypothetical protein